MAKVLMVVAPTNFRDEEYFEPRQVLENAGHSITVASINAGPLSGKLGGTAQADIAIDSINTAEYEAVVFVGGMGSAIFQNNPNANKIILDTLGNNKIVSAICLAPVILAKAGVLSGVNATCTPEAVKDILALGAIYVDSGVVKDGPIITADGPQSATEFGQTIAKSL